MTTRTRTLTRGGLAAAALTAITAVGLGSALTPAAAHAYLVDSTPEDGAAVDEVPTEIVLEFNEPIQPDFTQVAVLDANDEPLDLAEPEVDGVFVTQELAELVPGTYWVNYRVGSGDGHPVDGTIMFTVTNEAAPTPTPTSAPTTAQRTPMASAEPAPEPTVAEPTPTPITEPAAAGEGANTALWLGGAAAAVVAGATVLFLVLRRPGEGGGDV